MVPEALQPKALLAQPQALALQFRILLATDPSIENFNLISSHILDQVHTEAVPSSVFAVWLSLIWQHSGHFIANALRDPSYGVRKAAIKVVQRKLFRGNRWKKRGWDVLGGAQGIKAILDQLPVVEVRILAKAIFGRCYVLSDRKLVSACVEEFLALVEDAEDWTSRSLVAHLSFLSAYCNAERVEHLLRSQWRTCSEILVHISRFHTPLLRRIGVGELQMPQNVRLGILDRCRNSLLKSKVAYDPVYYRERHFERSPGLLFGMDLLMAMEKEIVQYNYHDLCSWVETILDQAIREMQPFETISLILNQGLALLQASASIQPRGSSGWLSQSLSQCVVQFWSISRFGYMGDLPSCVVAKYKRRRQTKALAVHQASLEHSLIYGVLQNKDESFRVQENAGGIRHTMVKLLSMVGEKGRLEFLRLLCRHSPSLGFDLESWPPSQTEEEFMPCWDLDILRLLPPDDSRLLFRRSLYIHHCDEFLPSSGNAGPISKFPSWEAQCLLWATWEFADPKGNDFMVTRKALGEMKQRSMRAREPPERLCWAERTIELATRTKSVDIFVEVVEWSKRFMRDPLVFPNLIIKTISNLASVLSFTVDSHEVTSLPKSWLLQEVQTGNDLLEDLLKTCILLLREPWAISSIARMIGRAPHMLSTILGHRMNIARKWPCNKSVPDSEVTEILLDSMIPILIDYEREASKEGQTVIPWSGLSGMIISHCLPSDPNFVELSFMDRLAKARNELWKQQRIQKDPNVRELSACWPRGLPIQRLVDSPIWLFHAMRQRGRAPFLSSRTDHILYSPATTVMHCITNEGGDISGFVDDLRFIIRAFFEHGEREDKVRDVLHVWEYYSQLLEPHPVYLGMFQDWLADMIQNREDMLEATKIIRPPSLPSRPTIAPMPRRSEIIEWDPREGDYPVPGRVHNDYEGSKKEKYREIPCTVLNCRMEGKIPSEAPFVRARKPQLLPEPLSIWSPELWSLSPDSQDFSCSIQDSIVLAALLFLDTYTKAPRLLRTGFPDVESPRYTPIYLADKFIAFESKRNPNEVLQLPIRALRNFAKKIPSQILRDLIWSFLDTLKAEPNVPMYPKLLFATFNLIEILLRTDKPQLAIDVVIRVWMEFANESSLHRKISLVKLGRVLTPEQAGEMVRGLASRVCNALQAQARQGGKMVKEEGKIFVKVTTAKMLAQALAQADFLSQSDQMDILQQMFNSSRHIDIRTAIVAPLLDLVKNSDSDEPYKVFASISELAAGPNERAQTTEAEWDSAENQQGPLPYVAPDSERPLLELMVSTAAFKLPERLRSDYVLNVLLPLLQDSTAQHTRLMTAMSARLGFSITDLKLTEQDIGPFVPDLPDRILWAWVRYLPGSYLEQFHRPWSLSFLHDGAFSRLDNALAATDDQALKHLNFHDHWNRLLNGRRARSSVYNLDRLLDSVVGCGMNASSGLSTALILDEFAIRTEVIIRNPFKFNEALKKYTMCPNSTLDPLRALRKSRVQTRYPASKATMYNDVTKVMKRTVDVVEIVRKERWSTTLTAGYPTTLPSTFEYDVLLLPSPLYIPTATKSNPALDLFTSAIIDLISKYACDPILLFKLDAFQPVMQEIPPAVLKTCSLRLGSCTEREERDLIVTCVRVKLARLLLDRARSGGRLIDKELLGMINEWKKSDVELVRQIGWEC